MQNIMEGVKILHTKTWVIGLNIVNAALAVAASVVQTEGIKKQTRKAASGAAAATCVIGIIGISLSLHSTKEILAAINKK
jgi:uncharacterized membrane protein